MVHSLGGPGGLTEGFVIKPNRAMPWGQLLVFYLALVLLLLVFSTFFIFKGMTLILPFYGIELLALGYALYVTARRSSYQEVITFDNDVIVVESGRISPETRCELQRYWAKMRLERSWNSWYPSRLLICSHGKQIEIGKFLNEQERLGLASELGKMFYQPPIK